MTLQQSIYSDDDSQLEKWENNLDKLAQLIFFFVNINLLKKKCYIDNTIDAYPASQIIGYSVSGEICQDEVLDENIVYTAVWFENSSVEFAEEQVCMMKNSYIADEKLAKGREKFNTKVKDC